MLRSVRIAVVSLVWMIVGVIAAHSPAFAGDWNFSGDFRLRYENTNNQEPGPLSDSRNREVVRFRLGATKAINDDIGFGVRLATGDQNDPNTADVTLGSFVNDLDVSLDRAYIDWKYKDLKLVGGKFANPFRGTDLVWDGDVNPQGVAASYRIPTSGQISAKVSGIFYIIDEHSRTTTPDSDMRGGQVEVSGTSESNIGLSLAVGYYDYNITSLSNADAGDTRSNYLNTAGDAYLSDFDLLNVIAVVDLPGPYERYPIRVVGDFVKNQGAEVDEDQGFSVDVFMGRASKVKDARMRYGYSMAETDAVLAAFSNDNTTIATNYRQHTVTAEYVVLENTTLDVVWYLHRKDIVRAGESDDWVSRIRVNAVVKF